MSAKASLKSVNLKWLCAAAALDLMLVAVFAFPEVFGGLPWPQLVGTRAVIAPGSPIVVLILTELLSPQVKASLVYWKGKQALPGHEAFTRYAPGDPRVDMKALASHVGTLPTAPDEQNRLWFKLYKAVESEPAVLDAHRLFLLYRDLAALSALLLVGTPLAFLLAGAGLKAIVATAVVFALQYLATAIAARHAGRRFVTNVLALHSVRKIRFAK